MSGSTPKRRFAIAVSFPGEHRQFVLAVVSRLAEVLGRDRIFYDEWYEVELLGSDGDLKLEQCYESASDLIVPFFSQHYTKPWCELEWHAIRAMLLERRKENAVVPVHLDDTKIDGWKKIDFGIRLRERTPDQIADLILTAYRLRHPDDPNEEPGTKNEERSIAPHYPPNVLPTYGEGFAGRAAELAELHAAWNDGQGTARVFVWHAEGGAGKTRLLVKWLTELRDRGWTGAGGVFVHSFYSQGSHEDRNASSEIFFEAALKYFGHPGEPIIDDAGRGQTLARLLLERRGLLVLDGLEPLQHPPAFDEGRLKDQAIDYLLNALSLAGPDAAGLCVITSRQPVVEMRDREGAVVRQRQLDNLDEEAGSELLRQLDVVGPEDELRAAARELRGHAYSLMLLGSYLRDATEDRDIRRRAELRLLDEDPEHRSHAAKLFAAYVRHFGEDSPETALLHLLGFFDRAADRQLLNVLRQPKNDALDPLIQPLANLSNQEWTRLLNRLEKLRLISTTPEEVDSHPLLREHFSERLQSGGNEEQRTKNQERFKTGHSRLFDHLCETTEHQPDDLPGLQPLYQAVSHGCLAGQHPEACDKVYRDRILRGTGNDGFYSTLKLGAIGADLGAVAAFFDEPWKRLSPNLSDADQAWLLNEAAYSLRALGRLTEAREPMRASIDMVVAQEDWKNAAIYSSNLSELEVTLGLLEDAVADGRRAIDFADRSNDVNWPYLARTTAADAIHQHAEPDAAEFAEARSLFEEADRMQAERQSQFPLLYSLQGFQYCDLILSPAERAVWKVGVHASACPGPERPEPVRPDTLKRVSRGEVERSRELQQCNEAIRRAQQTLEWGEKHGLPLLDIALDHLTLARAQLYRAHLESPDSFSLKPSSLSLSPALALSLSNGLTGLRQAGALNHLPKALLTAALFAGLRERLGVDAAELPEALRHPAEHYLAEAQKIAERGPMPLYLADVRLTRTRLKLMEVRRLKEEGLRLNGEDADFVREELQRARALIEKHHYHRRLPELRDAEAALTELQRTPRQLPPPADSPKTSKTVVELDLVGYSTICANLEESLDVTTTAQLNEQIQGFIDEGLAAAGVTRADCVMETTGDGAILFLPTAATAHAFIEAVHRATEKHNETKTQPLAKRVFRIGAAAGEVILDPQPDGTKKFGGMTIARAVRLESQAQPGGILIEQSAFEQLPADLQSAYGDPVTVKGKRDESFTARPRLVNVRGPADTEYFTELGNKPDKSDSPALKLWQEKLEFLQTEEAKASDPGIKFKLRQDIQEAKDKINELGGDA